MRSYVYYTYQILERIEVLNNIALWAGLHQERTDGSGYPFGYDEERIPLGARIMAVADVFAALTEDRPYRKSMTKKRAILLLESMTENEQLDPQVVGALLDHYDTLDLVKNQAHEEAAREYGEFQKAVSAEQ